MNRRTALLIFFAALVYTAATIQWSLRAGRLAMDPVADDVGYLVDGLTRLNLLDQHGLGALLHSLRVQPPHSPWSTALAFTGFALFGINDWSPYILNGSLVLILLFAGDRFLRQSNTINRILILSIVLMMPLTLSAVHDFRPDFAVGLFTAIFALMIVRLACRERTGDSELRIYFSVGLIGGMAYLAKPTFFPHTTVMWVAAFCLAEICYIAFSPGRLQPRQTLRRFGGLALGVFLLAGPYFLVAWRQIVDYFITASNASIWKVPGGVWNSFRIYLVGDNAVQMLGYFAPLLIAWILLGLGTSIINKSPRSGAFIICGTLLASLSASVVALGQMNNLFFALPWCLLFLLTSIYAIGETCRSERISVLAIGSAVLSVVLIFLRPPTTNVWLVSEDARVDNSLNYSVLKEIESVWATRAQRKEQPSVFLTFFGNVNAVSQSWLSLKHHIPINTATAYLSGSLTEQIQNAESADFIEAADPKSKWLTKWLPSTQLQESILKELRAHSGFLELPAVVGKEGTVYLFQRKAHLLTLKREVDPSNPGARTSLLNPIRGFSVAEGNEIAHVWAIDRSAELAMPKLPDGVDQATLSFDLSTLNARSVKVTGPDGQVQTVQLGPGESRHVDVLLRPLRKAMGSESTNVIRFETDAEGVKPSNGDTRTLVFSVANLTMR